MPVPRLLILCEYPTLLGGERSLMATLGAVQRAGWEVRVTCPPAGPLADALSAHGIRLAPWPVVTKVGTPPSLDDRRRWLQQILYDQRPLLIHGNSLSMARLAGPVAAAMRLKSIGHLRDIVNLSHQVIADVNRNTRLIAVSHATRTFHIAQGLDPEKCVVVQNGVDLNQFRPGPKTGYLHRELGLPPAARLVTTIGQIGLRKGTDIALNAMGRLMQERPTLHWLVVGERTSDKAESHRFEARLRGRVRELGLAGRVHFLGNRDDIARLLPECDLLLHAAHQEPLGRVLLEAAACGVPVVATEVGGTREIYPTEADGAILVPPGDPSSMAAAVCKLLEDARLRRVQSHNARRRAKFAFDAHVAADGLTAVYHAVLRREPGNESSKDNKFGISRWR